MCKDGEEVAALIERGEELPITKTVLSSNLETEDENYAITRKNIAQFAVLIIGLLFAGVYLGEWVGNIGYWFGNVVLPTLATALHHNDEYWDFVPMCARDVFIELHEEKVGVLGRNKEKSSKNCHGVLIRDDIILTRKECSKFNFTFHFPGVVTAGVVSKAVPHTSLNTEYSQLGFLQTNAPYHYHSINEPVRRNRVFLSRRGRRTMNDKMIECDDEGRPILYNFPIYNEENKKNHYELVPLDELEGIVPNDTLWEDDINIMNTTVRSEDSSGDDEHITRWWTQKVSLKEEESKIINMLDQYTGPPGSISVPGAHESFENKVGGLFEAIDPRGHRRQCFHYYYQEWREVEPFLGLTFFEWLDYGPGQYVLDRKMKKYDKKCRKSYFDYRTSHYFTDDEVWKSEVYLTPSRDGSRLIVRYKHNDEFVPDNDGGLMGDGSPHTYMWSLNKKLHIAPNVKHMDMLSGRPALSAGKLYIQNNSLWGINYSSGHYRPGIQTVVMMYQWMKEDMQYNTSAFYWIGRTAWSEWDTDCEDKDWDSIEVEGFTNATVMRHACHEVTTSPTWILNEDE